MLEVVPDIRYTSLPLSWLIVQFSRRILVENSPVPRIEFSAYEVLVALA